MKTVIKSLLALLLCAYGMQGAQAGLQLGATRVIFPATEKSVTVNVMNTGGDKAYLVQSEIKTTALEQSDDFVVTPPLFRLDVSGSNLVRIMKSGANFPTDREGLYWFSVRGIAAGNGPVDMKKMVPPTMAGGSVSMGVGLNIKLIYRPSGLPITWRAAMNELKVARTTQGVKLTNPSPYYISFESLKVGAHSVIGKGGAKADLMLAPFSSQDIVVAGGINASEKTVWSVINDFGGTDTFTGTMI